jgi:hypothetical protein
MNGARKCGRENGIVYLRDKQHEHRPEEHGGVAGWRRVLPRGQPVLHGVDWLNLGASVVGSLMREHRIRLLPVTITRKATTADANRLPTQTMRPARVPMESQCA